MTMSNLVTEQSQNQPAIARLAVRLAAVAATGLAVGVATEVLQRYLDLPWLSLVNSASPWLTAMFAVSALWPRPRGAALAGLAVGLLELIGYYAAAALRGYPAGHAILLFWAACAAAGGPVFGLAGWAWWRGPHRSSALGAAAPASAYLAEAAVAYGWRLHYWSSALLLVVLGGVAFGITGLRGRQHAPAALWLLATVPAAMAAELITGLIYSQSF